MQIQLALPFLMIIVSLLTVRLISFKTSMTTGELRMIRYVPERLEIPERQPITVSKDLKSPVELVKAPQKGFPPAPLSAMAPRRVPELKVSMIVVSEKQRMAIVSGLVVKEGDGIDRMRVAKIERNRILLKDVDGKPAETRWIYLDGIK